MNKLLLYTVVHKTEKGDEAEYTQFTLASFISDPHRKQWGLIVSDLQA